MQNITDIGFLDSKLSGVVVLSDKDVPDRRIIEFRRKGTYRFYPQYRQEGIPAWMHYLTPAKKSSVWAQDLHSAVEITKSEPF